MPGIALPNPSGIIPYAAAGASRTGFAPPNFWHAVEEEDRKRTRRPSLWWILAVAIHMAIAILFLLSLTRPAEPPIETAAIALVAPPAPTRVDPPPPKPVTVREVPKPRPIAQRAMPKPIARMAPPRLQAIASEPVPPPAEVTPSPPPPAPSQSQSQSQSIVPPTYLSALYAHLAANKHYPRAAQLAHVQGTALLHFTMNHQGQVVAYRLDRSSGHADLDAEVLAMIVRAQPLPMPPSDTPDPWELTIPVQFSVH